MSAPSCAKCGADLDYDDELCEDCRFDEPSEDCDDELCSADEPSAEKSEEDTALREVERRLAAEERSASEAAEREGGRRFGELVRVTADLLAVHKLPHDFGTAKQWFKEFGGYAYEDAENDPSDEIAAWLDAGWWNLALVSDALVIAGDPHEAARLLERAGLSVSAVQSGALDRLGQNLLDLLQEQCDLEDRGGTKPSPNKKGAK